MLSPGPLRTEPLQAAEDTGRRGRITSRWWRQRPWTPARIVAAYAVVGLLWIGFSDMALRAIVHDPSLRGALQTAKGAAFILITSALLFELIRRSDVGLRALGAEVRATFDSMLDGVLVVDTRHQIVEANRAAMELLGVERKEELLIPLEEWGRSFHLRYVDGTAVPPDQYASVRALAGERVPAYDAVVRRRDGRDVFVSVTAAPVRDASSQLELAVAVLRDVSAARRLDEMREEFLATAAHEFKTPLAVIKAHAQVMQRRSPPDPEGLTVIQRQVERLNRLVEHLLDTSRLRVRSGEGRRDTFDLTALAAEVVERTRAVAPGHRLTVAASGATVVSADRDRILRVITSLVDNAVRFSPHGGAVAIEITASGREAVVSVSDRGVGIPAERQARIFERYYRAHAGTPQDYGGLGLGLDMSREIVSRHGGRMWFESTPGMGSTFHFSLPLSVRPEGDA